MIRMFFLLIFSTILITAAQAQPDVVMDMVNGEAAKLIDSVMSRLNLRAEIFNDEIARVNKLRPLEAENLTKVKIEANIPIIKEFLSYLDVYRSVSDREKAAIADSIASLRLYLPKSRQKKYLKEFEDAYALDQAAFYRYTLALTALYTNVLELLNFMQTAQTEIKDNKITFKNQKEYHHYEQIMAKVEKQVKRQGRASLASQKASIDAGEMMQKAYGKLR